MCEFPRFLQLRHFFRQHLCHRKQSNFFAAKCDLMLPTTTFKGRTAYITGGGTGLGKGIAEFLARCGANVFIVSRKADVLSAACKELIEKTNSQNISFTSADVRDPTAVAASVDACSEKFGIPDIVVNNAAGNFISPTERLSPNAFGTVVDIVLKGTINVTLETAKRLIKAERGGSYLAITTTYAQTGSGYVVPSAVAKAGVESLVKSLAAEWGPYGLRFNGIAPGPIYTEGAFSRLDPTGQFREKVESRIPVRRMGAIEELANLAAYLLSDYANYINGEVVKLDGGELAFISGEFNVLQHLLTAKDWNAISKILRPPKNS